MKNLKTNVSKAVVTTLLIGIGAASLVRAAEGLDSGYGTTDNGEAYRTAGESGRGASSVHRPNKSNKFEV